jgi:predicted SAM-dependent methyltransferase
MKLLNLGCGKHYNSDWTNVDFVSTGPGVIAHNLSKGVPYEDASFDVVYHSHVLEHFSKNDGQKFIHECNRVLKPGGIIRIAVPDLETLANEYLKNLRIASIDDSALNEANYDWSVIELMDQMVRKESGGEMASYWMQNEIINEQHVANRMGWEFRQFRQSLNRIETTSSSSAKRPIFNISKLKQRIIRRIFRKQYKELSDQKDMLELGRFRVSGEVHQWMYDRYSLKRLLENTGFSQPSVKAAITSDIPNWSLYELDAINGIVRKPDSLFMEAKK